TRAERIGLTAMASGTPFGPRPGPADVLTGRSRQDPRDPPLRLRDLLGRRERLGAVPEPGEGRAALGLRNGPHELLALGVLLELEVHARQLEHRALEPAAPLAPLVESRRDGLDALDEPVAHLVHDVVAEALEQAHHRLRLAE